MLGKSFESMLQIHCVRFANILLAKGYLLRAAAVKAGVLLSVVAATPYTPYDAAM